MTSSLTNLVDNIAEQVQKIKYKYGYNYENMSTWN